MQMLTVAVPLDGRTNVIGEESKLQVGPAVMGPAKSTLICDGPEPAVVGSNTTISLPSLSGCELVGEITVCVSVNGTITRKTGFESIAGLPGL